MECDSCKKYACWMCKKEYVDFKTMRRRGCFKNHQYDEVFTSSCIWCKRHFCSDCVEWKEKGDDYVCNKSDCD
jgi:hypothetical protein